MLTVNGKEISSPEMLNIQTGGIHVGDRVSGTMLMQEIKYFTTRYDKPAAMGTIRDTNVSIRFKIWDASLVSLLSSSGLTGGVVVNVEGALGEYQGTLEVAITSMTVSTTESPEDYSPSLDCVKLWNEMQELVKDNFSPHAVNIVGTLFNTCNITERFIVEQAASRMHDSIRGGLLNHTLKALKLMLCAVQLYGEMLAPVEKDLLLAGVLVHDIGKVKEMHSGVYLPNSFVTHRHYGVEMLSQCKTALLQGTEKFAPYVNNAEEFYYHLVAIIIGHHDKFEEPAKTLYAKLVHLIDACDAAFTVMLENRESGTGVSQTSAGHHVTYDSQKLYFIT